MWGLVPVRDYFCSQLCSLVPVRLPATCELKNITNFWRTLNGGKKKKKIKFQTKILFISLIKHSNTVTSSRIKSLFCLFLVQYILLKYRLGVSTYDSVRCVWKQNGLSKGNMKDVYLFLNLKKNKKLFLTWSKYIKLTSQARSCIKSWMRFSREWKKIY